MSKTNSQATGLAAKPLTGRVALVTGGTRGIGAAICADLATQGAVVAAGYSRDREHAEAFRGALAEGHAGCSVHQGNVGMPEDCRRTVAEVIEQHGRLDILVNNAGITIDKTISRMGDDDWRKVVDINLSGSFFMSQAALPHMVKQGGGRIVYISSIAGQMGNIGQSNYAASKSGLFGLTKTLARECAAMLAKEGKLGEESIGLTVNCVAPGIIATEMLAHVPEKVMDRMKAVIPVGRAGRADEVARVVGFLCADASSYITGQVWAINGGWDM
ncbi:MAG: 3-oxoacyl-ACP reductase family protein [Stagnimonas sp.]|nr:3-oxoacyl-ACP reductase family protein [Stagnimonas sp.]